MINKYKQIKIVFIYAIIFIGLSVCLTACPEVYMEEYAINFYNYSTSDVNIYLANPGDKSDEEAIADTILPISYASKGQFIPKNGGYVYLEYRHFKGESYIRHLFVFDVDTLNNYSWEEVRAGYKVLKRYDLNVENGLKEFKSLITYPPSDSMKDVPMYPPYQ